jgi:TDG/mug DNA glycosylase family protein
MDSLPDYLRPGLDIVFVGLNPGAYSAKLGHYFARTTNRFWPAVRAAGLVPADLGPLTDHQVLEYGLGFTDVVKRPSNGAADLRVADFRQWAPVLREKLERCQPLIACFHGLTGYRNYLKYAEGLAPESLALGPQDRAIGRSRVFVVPNPSPANAVYRLEDLTAWYLRLRDFRDELRKP